MKHMPKETTPIMNKGHKLNNRKGGQVLIHSWFRRIMMVINCLFALPVVFVIIRELTSSGPFRTGRVLATTALVALPLVGTMAITIAGLAVLSED